MDLATVSLLALLFAVLASCVATINVGLLGFTLAWGVGVYVAPSYGVDLSAKDVVAGLPADLIITLIGVSLLFSEAQTNGTLDQVSRWGIRLCRGRAAWVPVMFFILTALLAGMGAGNIAAVALVAPAAMIAARQSSISPMVMALMIGHGSIAGAMSPLSTLGIIADKELVKIGLGDHAYYVFGVNFAINAAVAAAGYLMFGGWKSHAMNVSRVDHSGDEKIPAFDRRHIITLAVIAVLFGGVVFAKVHLGLGALAAAAILLLVRAADERESIRALPWGVVLMLAGMSTLVALVERTGGIERFSEWLAALSSASTASGVLAFTTGVLSIFSSTSTVVLPTFLPLVDHLTARIPGADELQLATSVVVGGNLVDVSPVSTIGALCLAAAAPDVDRRKLYLQMLAWGVAMALVAAVICQWVL